MENADFLNQVFTEVKSLSVTIDDKLDRLQRAKYNLLAEQTNCMNEINQIKDPSLHSLWDGRRANKFIDAREDAFHTMRTTIQHYDSYINQIEAKITELHQQMEYVNTTGSLAHTADELLQRNEGTRDELGTIIQQLQRRLFG